MFAGFSSFCRFVPFDKRGTGLSDRAIEVGSFDERVDDMKAVLDDAGVEQSYVMGLSEGGPMAIVFAATYPERTLGLILAATTACFAAGPDDDQRGPLWHEWSTAWPERWGTAETVTLERLAPSLADDVYAGEIERRGTDIGGIGVHIAARVEAKAAPGELIASRTVKDLVVGSLIRFEDRGTHQLKGVDDDWQLYAVTDVGSTRPRVTARRGRGVHDRRCGYGPAPTR